MTRSCTRHRIGLVVAAAATLLPLAFASSDRVAAANTPVTLTVTGGSLAITVPANADLGTVVNKVGGTAFSGALGQVVVSDARSAAAGSGWVVSVIATALTPASGPTIGAALIGYTAGAITKVGTATFTANDPPDLTGVVAAVTATGITGDNSATWTPTINIAVPGGMAAGAYTGIITHSVV